MSSTRISKLLEEGIARHAQELDRLQAIAAIVASNPQWVEQEPRLKELLRPAA